MPADHPPDLEEIRPVPGQTQPVPGEMSQRARREARNVPLSKGKAPPPFPDLPGEKRAGVWLTWGVLLIITLFLVAALAYLWTTQLPVCKMLAALGEPLSQALAEGKPLPEMLSTVVQQCETQQKAFYAFWLDMVQRILSNALLPVLTALLGYLFGTQQVRAAQE